jgi:hypothetical protein
MWCPMPCSYRANRQPHTQNMCNGTARSPHAGGATGPDCCMVCVHRYRVMRGDLRYGESETETTWSCTRSVRSRRPPSVAQSGLSSAVAQQTWLHVQGSTAGVGTWAGTLDVLVRKHSPCSGGQNCMRGGKVSREGLTKNFQQSCGPFLRQGVSIVQL